MGSFVGEGKCVEGGSYFAFFFFFVTLDSEQCKTEEETK